MEKDKITFYDIERFINTMQCEEKSQATTEKYKRDLVSFLRYLDGRPLSKDIIISYKAYLQQRYAVASANSMLAALNSFLRFLERQDLCVKQFRVQKKSFCDASEELTREEYLRLVHTAENKKNKRLSLLLQTICATGIRVSELCYITLDAVKRGRASVTLKGKTRIVFIPSALQKKLLKYAKHQRIFGGALFLTQGGKVVNRSHIWRQMKSLCQEAGVCASKVFPHNLRHLFARTFYSIEKDIAKLADILGHSSINTTRIYIVTTGEEHIKRLERMHLVT